MREPPHKTSKRRSFAPPTVDDHPLIRILIAEAIRRGDTLIKLAQDLGVSYRQFANWRNKTANVAMAGRGVLIAAGEYLGVPTAYILCIAEVIRIEDLTVKGRRSESGGFEVDMRRMRNDPRLAAFVPAELSDASPKVKSFVQFLYRELSGNTRFIGDADGASEWMRVLQTALLQTLENERFVLQNRKRD